MDDNNIDNKIIDETQDSVERGGRGGRTDGDKNTKKSTCPKCTKREQRFSW